MGCWNKTCGISQFPIFSGQKTVNFVLIEAPRWDNRLDSQPCYSNAYWDVIPLPIYGEYDDYGWQDDDDGQEYKYSAMSDFFKGRLKRLGKEGSFRDVADPFADCESLGQSIHGNVWAVNPTHISRSSTAGTQPHLHIASMMVNRELFETLTAGITVTYPKKHVYTKAELCETLVDYSQWRAKKLEDRITPDMTADLVELLYSRSMANDYTREKFGDHPYMNMQAGIVRYYAERGGTDAFMKDAFFPVAGERLQPFDIVDAFMFTRLMAVLRKQFMPQGGEGSQSDFGPEHKLLIKGLRSMITARNKLYE
jgi:hypothetical protein